MGPSDLFDEYLTKIDYFEPITKDSNYHEDKSLSYQLLFFQYEGNPDEILSDDIELMFDFANKHGMAIQKVGRKPLTINNLLNAYGKGIISIVKGGIQINPEIENNNYNSAFPRNNVSLLVPNIFSTIDYSLEGYKIILNQEKDKNNALKKLLPGIQNEKNQKSNINIIELNKKVLLFYNPSFLFFKG